VIEHIDIVNLSHYDIGFTDHPLVCRAMQRRYLEMAIDLTADNAAKPPDARYYWTCEANDVVADWWGGADSERRAAFLDRVQRGWIEVCAMPFNHTPALNARQWQAMAHWLPEEVWQACQPRVIMQNDVNGFPRAGALALMQRGAEFLWMGINSDTGGPPMPQPSAFWWQMPDGSRLLVWNSIHYGNGYFLFEPQEWRRGPLPGAGDPRYRPPRDGDIFDPTPANLARGQDICRAQLACWEAQGYAHRRLIVSVTNMWREDNDPPCPQLAGWVAAWNAAGLRPTLALATPGPALAALRAEAGEDLATLSGEWTNWWANGVAATPQELAASREAKRAVEALFSPLFAPSPARDIVAKDCLRQLCLFDEHTGGSWNSESMPDSWDSKGQTAEKQVLAYRPLAMAKLALGDALRARTAGLPACPPRVLVVNPFDEPYTGWIALTDDCLRGEYAGVRDTSTGALRPFDRMPGPSPFYTVPTEAGQFSLLDTGKVFPDRIAGKSLRFWVDTLPAHTMRSFDLLSNLGEAPQPATPSLGDPQVSTDELGWPIGARWGDTQLFDGGIGDFLALEFGGLAPRWTYKQVLALPDEASRRAARERLSTLTNALPIGRATMRDTGPTLLYEQYLSHPRLRVMRRTLELFKDAPRARLHVTLNRLSRPESAEILTLRIPVHAPGYQLTCSNGGLPFVPGQDQMAHTCADYYAVDGRVIYTPPAGEGEPGARILECYDNLLLSFGGVYNGLMRGRFEGDASQVYAILYDNIWYTNFAGDASGVMDLRFDLYAAPYPDGSASARDLPGYAPRAWAVVDV